MRTNAKKALSLYVKKEKNVKVIEKHILNTCITKKCTPIEESYKQLVISVCVQIQQGNSLQDVLDTIKKGNVLWDDTSMSEYKHKLEEQDNFLENPFEIEDGVIECNKCGSKRTYSYTKQTRSGDEATTVFSVCAECGAKWKS